MLEADLTEVAEKRDDRCPECVPEGTALPLDSLIDPGSDTLTCWYACALCGHRWFTNWSLDFLLG